MWLSSSVNPLALPSKPSSTFIITVSSKLAPSYLGYSKTNIGPTKHDVEIAPFHCSVRRCFLASPRTSEAEPKPNSAHFTVFLVLLPGLGSSPSESPKSHLACSLFKPQFMGELKPHSQTWRSQAKADASKSLAVAISFPCWYGSFPLLALKLSLLASTSPVGTLAASPLSNFGALHYPDWEDFAILGEPYTYHPSVYSYHPGRIICQVLMFFVPGGYLISDRLK